MPTYSKYLMMFLMYYIVRPEVIPDNELRSEFKTWHAGTSWLGLSISKCDHSKTWVISTTIRSNFFTWAISGKHSLCRTPGAAAGRFNASKPCCLPQQPHDHYTALLRPCWHGVFYYKAALILCPSDASSRAASDSTSIREALCL